MSLSPDQELTLRRKLLVNEAQLQRLRLSRDLQTLGRAAAPERWGRQLWQQGLSALLTWLAPTLAARSAPRWMRAWHWARGLLRLWSLWQSSSPKARPPSTPSAPSPARPEHSDAPAAPQAD